MGTSEGLVRRVRARVIHIRSVVFEAWYIARHPHDLHRNLVRFHFPSPASVIVPRDENAVDEIQRVFGNEGVFAGRLKVNRAYHSSQALEQWLCNDAPAN